MKELTTSLPQQMLWQDRLVPLDHYLRLKADQLTEKHAKDGVFFGPNDVQEYLNICKEGHELTEEEEDRDAWKLPAIESCCQDLASTHALTLHSNDEAPSEIAIIESARSITLDNGFDRLKEHFDFGQGFTQLVPRNGAGAKEYADAFVYFSQMANKGAFGMAKAAMALEERFGERGENILVQLCGDLGIASTTLYNAIRTEKRIPLNSPCRELLPPTVISEILLPKYPGTEEERKVLREQLLEQAVKEKWNAQEARSHVQMHKKKDAQDEVIDTTVIQDRFLCVETATGTLWTTQVEPEYQEGVVVVELASMVYLQRNGELNVWLDVPVKGEA